MPRIDTGTEAGSIDIPVASVAKDLTVQVNLKGLRTWHLRLRLGILFVRFGIWVAGMGCEIGGPQDGRS
jgi:hypothetical protein